MNKADLAKSYFLSGYNCCQSVVLAFKEELNIDESTLLKLASPFGGGMGRLREVCGTFSGILIVLGNYYGYDDPKANEAKSVLYAKIQELAKQFEKDNGSIVCRDLLGLNEKHSSPNPEVRNETYYAKRPCPELVYYAVNLLQDYLENDK